MENPKLALIPSGYKSGKVYSILPVDGVGDFDFNRSSGSSRVNKNGLIETVSNQEPRLDWLNSDCPSLLLEPQRINLQIRSEEFGNAAWVKSRTSITSNDAISPKGTQDADKSTGDGTGASYIYDGVTLTNGVAYTISIFVKPIINISSFSINVFGGVGTATFNLLEQTVSSLSGDFTSAKIDDYGNGWLRCSGTLILSSTTGTKNIGYGLIDYDGDQFYLFGAQVEDGNYPSSYIKTEASTVTRLKDECLNGGDSDLFDITEGTFFIDVVPYINSSSNHYIGLTAGSSSDRFVFIFQSYGTQVRLFCQSTNSGNFLSRYQNITFNQRNKLAVTFKENEYKFYVNGSLVYTDTSGSVPTGLSELSFSSYTQVRNFEGKVHDTRVYDRVLTEAEAKKLTTI